MPCPGFAQNSDRATRYCGSEILYLRKLYCRGYSCKATCLYLSPPTAVFLPSPSSAEMCRGLRRSCRTPLGGAPFAGIVPDTLPLVLRVTLPLTVSKPSSPSPALPPAIAPSSQGSRRRDAPMVRSIPPPPAALLAREPSRGRRPPCTPTSFPHSLREHGPPLGF